MIYFIGVCVLVYLGSGVREQVAGVLAVGVAGGVDALDVGDGYGVGGGVDFLGVDGGVVVSIVGVAGGVGSGGLGVSGGDSGVGAAAGAVLVTTVE